MSESDIPVFFTNHNLHDIVTPIKVDVLEELLKISNYPKDKTEFLIEGFTNGFDIGYEAPKLRKDTSNNIPFKVGNQNILWNKIMKEVQLGRFAGPYDEIPFEHFMQSPVGLVPKSGNKTRLIFHLSYEFSSSLGSLNSNTNKEKCSVRYKDLDHAMQNCMDLLKKLERQGTKDLPLVFSKSDLTSAFQILPLKRSNFPCLVLKAVNPKTGKTVE